MKRTPRFAALSRPLILLSGCLFICGLLAVAGCGSRKPEPSADDGPPGPASANPTTNTPTSRGTTRRPPAPPATKTAKELQFEAAQKKEAEITNQLEQADKMMKGTNLEGALRLVKRVEQENSQDPYVTMRTSYLQAMIFNRLHDATKRKEAMNQLLKSMEALQNDPRFQQGFIDGQANQELIKMSLEQAGARYGN